MRRPSRAAFLALVVLVAALVGGCGGSEIKPDEVPGDPVTLTVPSDDELGGGGAAADAAGTDDAAGDDDAATADDAADDAATTPDPAATAEPVTPAGDDGGAVAPAPTQAPAQDPAADPDSGGTSEFCEQNQGAC